MQTIRSRKLDSYWKDDISRQWYLIEDRNGNPLGYREAFWRKTHNGFSGANRLVLRKEGHVENWQVSSDAARGQYVAVSDTSGGGRDRTQIMLQDGLVIVAKAAPNTLGEAQNRAPGNYVPEGLLPLAIVEAARLGQKVSFKTIINEQAIIQGMVYFSLVTVIPQGPNEVRVESVGLGEGTESVYRLDDQARIVAIEYGGGAMVEKLVSFRELTDAFPHLAEEENQEDIRQQAPPYPDNEGRQQDITTSPGITA